MESKHEERNRRSDENQVHQRAEQEAAEGKRTFEVPKLTPYGSLEDLTGERIFDMGMS